MLMVYLTDYIIALTDIPVYFLLSGLKISSKNPFVKALVLDSGNNGRIAHQHFYITIPPQLVASTPFCFLLGLLPVV